MIQTWEKERFTSPQLQNKWSQRGAGLVKAQTHSVNKAYLSKLRRSSIGMLKLVKVGTILRELPQGNKTNIHILRRKITYRGSASYL